MRNTNSANKPKMSEHKRKRQTNNTEERLQGNRSSDKPLRHRRLKTGCSLKKKRNESIMDNKSADSFELLDAQSLPKNNRYKFQIINQQIEIDMTMMDIFKQRVNDFKTDYLVCGVIGTQSTGKSTMLNHIFNCEFDMLNSKEGRKQTTKGIWGSFIDEAKMLVLDIEGSDSMKRSISDQNAENKICTFGLLMTHVLLSKTINYSFRNEYL